MSSSPRMPVRPAPTSRREMDMNLSPLMASPTSYQENWPGNSNYGPAYSQPMKHKDRSTALIPTAGPVFPPSPSYMLGPNTYFDHCTVPIPMSGRTSDPVDSLHQGSHLYHSPNMQSATGLCNGFHHSLSHPSQNGSLFRQSNPAPILIAPNPPLRTSMVKQDYGSIQQNSMSLPPSPPRSRGPSHGIISGPTGSLPSRGKKSQKIKESPGPLYDAMASSGELNEGERLLLKLTTEEHLQWKEVRQKWNKEMNLDKTVAALQMRKKRLMERIKV
jgi:hypothetical protein